MARSLNFSIVWHVVLAISLMASGCSDGSSVEDAGFEDSSVEDAGFEGSSVEDAGSEQDAGSEPPCEDGHMRNVQCGLNDRGEREEICEEGTWQSLGECTDPDECIDDALEEQACEIGDLGIRDSTCIQGTWDDSGPCRLFSFSLGGNAGCAVREQGRMMCWGGNTHGQLAIGEASASSDPIPVPGLEGVRQVSMGTHFGCLVAEGGEVRCWGRNHEHQAGQEDDEESVLSPEPVVGIDDAIAVSVNAIHACALRANGRVSCWGSNLHGRLGHGEFGDGTHVPGEVVIEGDTPLEGITEISVGGAHACALDTGGEIWCWGNNLRGQLGNGNTTNSPFAVSAASGLTGVVAIDAGHWHTCALHEEGHISCWGHGIYGQLGNGLSNDDVAEGEQYFETEPVAVHDLDDAIQISLGRAYSCALRDNGQVACWGRGHSGQLGNGLSNDDVAEGEYFETEPVAVTGLDDAVAILAESHASLVQSATCAFRSNGEATCWGNASSRRLGNGETSGNFSTPQPFLWPPSEG